MSTTKSYSNRPLALLVLAALAASLMMLAPARPAQADTLIVTNTNDTETGASLRASINHANANPGADTIRFDQSLAGQTITLQAGPLPTITSDGGDLTVDGGNADITIDAFGQPTIFQVGDPPGTGIRSGVLHLKNLTMTKAESSASPGIGGALHLTTRLPRDWKR